MRRLLANRLVLAILVVVLLGALFEVAGASHPVSFAEGTPLHQQTRAAISAAVRGCPGPGSAGATSGGIAVTSAPASAGAGQAAVIPLSPGGSTVPAKPQRILTQPGRLAVVGVARAAALPKKLAAADTAGGSVPTVPGRGGVIVQATGSMSQGLEVEQTGPGGLATGRCEAPATDFWFAGPGGRTVSQIQLYLMNVDSQPADVQVSALTEGIPLLAGSDIGITVPPHGMVVQSLAKLMRGSTVMALQVSASAGRVVAALQESKRPTEPGAWLPPTSAPATRQVLPSVPGSPGTRELYIGVPGSQDAQVKVTAITARGSYQPTGGSGIALPGGSAVGIALPSLAGIPAAVMISSSVPVTAAMLVSGGAPGAPGAFTAGSAAVQEQGVVADIPAGKAASAELVLSAPHAAAQVRIVVAGSNSVIAGQAGKVVQVAAGRTVVVRLHPPSGPAKASAYSVAVIPLVGSGPVYAGRVLSTGGTVQSILAVASSPTWVALPPVRDSLATVLP